MKHLTIEEKKRIVDWSLTGKYNLKEIAEMVGRSEATVSYTISKHLKEMRVNKTKNVSK